MLLSTWSDVNDGSFERVQSTFVSSSMHIPFELAVMQMYRTCYENSCHHVSLTHCIYLLYSFSTHSLYHQNTKSVSHSLPYSYNTQHMKLLDKLIKGWKIASYESNVVHVELLIICWWLRIVIGAERTSGGEIISYLNISETQVRDGGLYSCQASNSISKSAVIHQARLNIYGIYFTHVVAVDFRLHTLFADRVVCNKITIGNQHCWIENGEKCLPKFAVV